MYFTMSEVHNQWHSAFPDTPWDCPLDCGIGDDLRAEYDWKAQEEAHHIICGACKDLHETVAEVRACYASAT